MALLKNDYSNGVKQMPEPNGSEVVSVRLAVSIPLASSAYDIADIANDDIWFLGFLPANCVPVDCMLDIDDFEKDAGDEFLVSVGLLDSASAPTDLEGTAWIASSTAGQAGGTARPTTTTMSRVVSSNAKRGFGIKVVADPEVDQTAGGPFVAGVILSYRASAHGA